MALFPKTKAQRLTLCGAVLATCALTACAPSVPVEVEVERVPAPQPRVLPVDPKATDPSAESLALRNHYERVEAKYLAQGLLRRDGGGPDTAFTHRQLVDNFVKIALYNEYHPGSLAAGETRSVVRRWEKPVRMDVRFSATLPSEQRAEARADVAKFAQRLSRLTNVPVSLGASRPNFHVLFLNEEERAAIGPTLRELMPQASKTLISKIEALPQHIYCLVAGQSEAGSGGAYSKVVVIIRAEMPDLMRLSCIHEELAQGFGLTNDSPLARPSIFNDDEEFALLTTHDEMLLRILYDRRLKVGMPPAEARLIAAQIAEEMVGGPS